MTELRHESGAILMFQEYIEAWGAHRTDRVLAFFADECVYENLARGAVYRGKEELGAWVAATSRRSPTPRSSSRPCSRRAAGWVASG